MNATIFLKTWGTVALAMAAFVVPVQAQEIREPGQVLSMSQQPQTYAVLHVDAAMGDDQRGVGNVERPYKTITQALTTASPNASTVILLAPGHYSQATGEQFPLRLRPGITIQGNAGETRNTLVVGSGDFRDGTATQNATLVAADRSGLANVTVSNPKGSGVWITAGTPVLRRVALVSNGTAGVQVTHGAPIIENSYFHRNPLGLVIQGNSRAIVRGNYFEATGRAITIASPATPIINNNRIAHNDVGIALKNNARPVLDANVLDGNDRNGVVEMDSTVAAAPRNSVFESAVGETLTVEENVTADADVAIKPALKLPELAPAPAPEAVVDIEVLPESPDLLEQEASVSRSVVGGTLPRESTIRGTVLETVPGENPTEESAAADVVTAGAADLPSFRQHLAASTAAADREQPPILQRRQLLLSNPSAESSVESSSDEIANDEIANDDASFAPSSESLGDGGIAIAVVPAAEPVAALERAEASNLLARLQRTVPVATTLAVSSATADAVNVPEPLFASGQRLPVPSAAIPSGGGTGHLTPPGTVSITRTFRYQVLVNMADAEDLQVLVPDAFRTRVGSRMVMQAGAYEAEDEARERLEWLRDNGIEGRVNLRE